MASSCGWRRAAVVGTGCMVAASAIPGGVAAGQGDAPMPTVLDLACRILGGGFAIRDHSGRTLENGDGLAFSPTPRFVLEITREPRRVRILEGVLPHGNCASGPVSGSPAPLGFTWCTARYEITPDPVTGFTLRSMSRSVLTTGPRAGGTMGAFMVGSCVRAGPAAGPG